MKINLQSVICKIKDKGVVKANHKEQLNVQHLFHLLHVG